MLKKHSKRFETKFKQPTNLSHYKQFMHSNSKWQKTNFNCSPVLKNTVSIRGMQEAFCFEEMGTLYSCDTN